MHHLIIGYGYCGYYLAQQLIEHQQEVTAVSRNRDPSMRLTGLNYLAHDIAKPLSWQKENTILYYLIPPKGTHKHDSLLRNFLANSSIQPAKVIYYGSSGVYGDHQGAWVDEQSPCYGDTPRQLLRLDAEQQWLRFSKQQKITCVLLRIAGIYGPNRLPIEAAKAQIPLIEPNSAPYVNSIYVKDLSNIAYQLTTTTINGIYNVADGKPKRMGMLQQHLAQTLKIQPAPYESWQQAWDRASIMKREFMQSSKRLRINALEKALKQALQLTPLDEAITESLASLTPAKTAI